MDQQNRIAGGADLIFFPQRIALLLGKVETVLCLHQSAGPPKEKKVDHRAPPQTDEQDTQRQPQPSGGKDDAEKPLARRRKRRSSVRAMLQRARGALTPVVEMIWGR